MPSASASPAGRSGRLFPRELLVVLVAATLARLPLLLGPVFHPDLEEFARWAWEASAAGLESLYSPRRVDYPPGYIHILSMLGDLARAWELPGPPRLSQSLALLMKLPGLASDLALGYLVFTAARRWLPDRRAVLICTLVVLNPGLVFATAVWGQVDSLHTSLMVGALVAALAMRWRWAGAAWALAFLTKAQSVVALPVLLVLTWRAGAAAGRAVTVGGLLAAGLVLVPLIGAPLVGVIQVYLGSVERWPVVSMQALNLWYFALNLTGAWEGFTMSDQQALVGPFSYRQVGLALFTAWVGLVLGCIGRRRDDAAVWLGAGAVALGFFSLLTQMHERYLYPAVVFSALAAGRWRGLGVVFGLLSVTFWLNLLFAWPVNGTLPDFTALLGHRMTVAVAGLNVLALAATGAFLFRLPSTPQPDGPGERAVR